MTRNDKRVIIIIITVIFAMVLSKIFGRTITHFAPEYGVTTANVNLRNAPNKDYSSFVRTLKPDTKIKVVGSIENYYIVQLETNEVGIISKEYAKITGNKINADVYTDYEPFYATVNGDSTLVRGGPSTSFKVYGKLNTGDKVYVIGAINDFLLVITDSDLVGMIRQDLVTKVDNTPNEVQNVDTNNNNNNNEDEDKANAAYILGKINNIRNENGLPSLSSDSLIMSVAQNKANDMAQNNYFSHTSPNYGTPFEMLKNAGVIYKTAGENIAGNTSIDAAIDSFINSSEHSKNILSNSYNYVGIGIEKSDKYGYIIVIMFVGR